VHTAQTLHARMVEIKQRLSASRESINVIQCLHGWISIVVKRAGNIRTNALTLVESTAKIQNTHRHFDRSRTRNGKDQKKINIIMKFIVAID